MLGPICYTCTAPSTILPKTRCTVVSASYNSKPPDSRTLMYIFTANAVLPPDHCPATDAVREEPLSNETSLPPKLSRSTSPHFSRSSTYHHKTAKPIQMNRILSSPQNESFIKKMSTSRILLHWMVKSSVHLLISPRKKRVTAKCYYATVTSQQMLFHHAVTTPMHTHYTENISCLSPLYSGQCSLQL